MGREHVTIRTMQAGDEAVQAAIYNEAAAALPRLKPATSQEIQRRTHDRDFDPGLRFCAEVNGHIVGYCSGNANGRVSYPWCRPGFESWAEPLFSSVLTALRARGQRLAFAAYRADWTAINAFFAQHGFRHARDMVSFVMDIVDMPTVPARPSSTLSSLRPADLPALIALAPEALRIRAPAELEKHLFQNPYFSADAFYTLRPRNGEGLLAVGLLIDEPTYADPTALDANMPCFRLGAFGTEGMQAKRVRGLFSLLAKNDHNLNQLGLDLLGQASLRLRDSDDVVTFAAQAPSDAPHLLKFYERNFRKQGSFPVYERELG